MYAELNLIKDGILTKEHIDLIYDIYVSICPLEKYKLTPQTFMEVFSNIFANKNLSIESKNNLRPLFSEMDMDDDGRITFQDFIKFIYKNVYLLLGETKPKKGLNKLHSISTFLDKKIFISIISNFILSMFDITFNVSKSDNNLLYINYNNFINPFWLCDQIKNYLPLYIYYTKNINRNCNIRDQECDVKLKKVLEMFNNLNDNNILRNIYNLISGSNQEQFFEGLVKFKKILKPINYLNNNFIVLIYSNLIINSLINIANNQIFERLLDIWENNSTTIMNDKILYCYLKIFKRLLYLSFDLFETIDYCKNNNITYAFKENSKVIEQINNYRTYFFNKYIIILLSRLNECLASNYIEISQCACLIIIKLIKYDINVMSKYIKEFNFMEAIKSKIKTFVDNHSNTNLSTLEFSLHELNIALFCCINVCECVITYYQDINNSELNEINSQKNQEELNKIKINNDFLDSVINYLNQFAINLSEHFFNLSHDFSAKNSDSSNQASLDYNITQSMYLVFLGLLSLTQKSKFDDRIFIIKLSQLNIIKVSETNDIIYPFYFYLKSIIKNNSNGLILNIISEMDILYIFYSFSTYNPNIISDYLDLIEILILEHKEVIKTSSIITKIFSIFSEFFLAKNINETLVKIIKIINDILKIKDPIINSIFMDTSLITYIILFLNENWVEMVDYNDFVISRKKFNTILLDNAFEVIESSIVSTNYSKLPKSFLEHFSKKNLEIIFSIFKDLIKIWVIPLNQIKNNDNDNDNDEDNVINNINLNIKINNDNLIIPEKNVLDNMYIFDKYKEICRNNLLSIIIKIFSDMNYYLTFNLENRFIQPPIGLMMDMNKMNLNNNNSNIGGIVNKLIINNNIINPNNDSEIEKIKFLNLFVRECLQVMKSKIKNIELDNDLNSLIDNKSDPEFRFYIQNKVQSTNQIYCEFKLSGSMINYETFLKKIKDIYHCTECSVYYFQSLENSNLIPIQINNEEDFINLVKDYYEKYYNHYFNYESNIIYVNLFIIEVDNSNIIYITTCYICKKEFKLNIPEKEKKNFKLNNSNSNFKQVFICDECNANNKYGGNILLMKNDNFGYDNKFDNDYNLGNKLNMIMKDIEGDNLNNKFNGNNCAFGHYTNECHMQDGNFKFKIQSRNNINK